MTLPPGRQCTYSLPWEIQIWGHHSLDTCMHAPLPPTTHTHTDNNYENILYWECTEFKKKYLLHTHKHIQIINGFIEQILSSEMAIQSSDRETHVIQFMKSFNSNPQFQIIYENRKQGWPPKHLELCLEPMQVMTAHKVLHSSWHKTSKSCT
jgi:hypothetical protein